MRIFVLFLDLIQKLRISIEASPLWANLSFSRNSRINQRKKLKEYVDL